MNLEVVDLEPFRTGSQAQRLAVAGTVDRVYRTSGFLEVVGHGVSPDLIEEMLSTTASFFDLPLVAKQACIVADKTQNRGYASEGTEALAYSLGEEPTAPDLFEAFNAGREIVDEADRPYFDAHKSFFAPNIWPEEPAALRDVWIRYQQAIAVVSDCLLSVFALALDVPESYFIDRTRRAIATTRAINYERRPGSPDPLPGQARMGAHTDYGIVTVLLADNVPGLQVRHQGEWIDVPVASGSFVVNIGDMLATWTNDRWVSTLHRVVPPPVSADGPVRRRSVASFLEADPDAIIEPVSSCVTGENPARYQPISAGDYLMAKLMGPRELRKTEL